MALQAASAIQQAAVLAPSAGLRAAVLPSLDFNFNLSMEGILPTLDLFLENGFQVNSKKVEGEFESNGVTYHYQETISYTDTAGEEKTYTLLYNMTGSKTETEEDETEVTTNFEGVATINENTTWKFSSTIKAETEGQRRFHPLDRCKFLYRRYPRTRNRRRRSRNGIRVSRCF